MAYTPPAKTAVDFTDSVGTYTPPLKTAVDFVLDLGPQILAPGPLGAFAASVYNDSRGLVTGTTNRWIMRVSGDPVVEIPISSWQGTLQNDRECYLQCVVPGVENYSAILAARQSTETFTVLQELLVGEDLFYQPIYSAPLDTIQVSQGAFRNTATVSGYTPPITIAPVVGTIDLQNITLISQTLGSNARARGAIDYSTYPNNQINADGLLITVAYVNMYATSQGEAYMDVGSR